MQIISSSARIQICRNILKIKPPEEEPYCDECPYSKRNFNWEKYGMETYFCDDRFSYVFPECGSIKGHCPWSDFFEMAKKEKLLLEVE